MKKLFYFLQNLFEYIFCFLLNRPTQWQYEIKLLKEHQKQRAEQRAINKSIKAETKRLSKK